MAASKLLWATCEVCHGSFSYYRSQSAAGRFCGKPCESIGTTTPLQERIDAHLIDAGLPVWHPEYGICRTWTSPTVSNGYGRMTAIVNGNRRPYGVHVLAWIAAGGIVPPKGYDIGHTCDVRLCAQNEGQGTYTVDGVLYERRGHLWLGTRKANMRDAKMKERHVHGESHRQIMRKVAARGESAGGAKLTEPQIREMRTLRAQGWKLKDLAARYSITVGAVSLICRGLMWAHVT